MAAASFLKDITSFSRQNLKGTTTTIRTRSGELYEETRNPNGSLTTVSKGKEVVPSYLEDNEKGISSINPMIFDLKRNEWVDSTSLSKEDMTTESDQKEESNCCEEEDDCISFVTYNVWFKDYYLAERASALLEIVKTIRPHVFCFQEVTLPFLNILLEEEWIRSEYALSDASGSTVYPYGVLIGTRFAAATLKMQLRTLPSNMGRRFLTCEISDKTFGGLTVGTVHLESLRNAEFRIEQLQFILEQLESTQHAIVMGDFNFGDGTRENEFISSDFLDFWPTLHPDEKDLPNGLTYPPDRIDRVILKSTSYKPKKIEVIGKDSIKDFPKVRPSDHYGIWTEISLS